jgi:hypothetical protein
MSAPDRPIFIGGLAYSGKTPVRLVLDKSDEVLLTRKSYLWPRYFNRLGDLSDPRSSASAIDTVLADPSVRKLAPDGGIVRQEFAEGAPSYARLFGIIYRQHATRAGRPRWGEQLGLVEAFADPILDAFPEARIVHMVRDPRDRLTAAAHTSFGRTGWEAAKWRYSARLARENAQRHADRYRIVRYEQLMADPRATMRSICEFIGLTMTNPMLEAIDLIADHRSRANVVARRQRFVERHTSSELADLGYAAPGHRSAPRLSTTVGTPLEQLGVVAFRLTKHRALARQTGAR